MKTPVQIFVLICFVIWLGIGIWGITEIPVGQMAQKTLLEDSYLVTYYDTIEGNFFYGQKEVFL